MRVLRATFLALCWLVATHAALAQGMLPALGHVADFHMTERSGRPVSLSDLEGKVWVADFIYTTCPGPCPLMTRHMAELQKSLPADDRLRLVSITVDPANDTPPVLSHYADLAGADPKRWWFLTGDEQATRDLLKNSFHITAEKGSGGILHSNYFVLVDVDGHLRGYYDSTDKTADDRLQEDVRHLLASHIPWPWSALPTINAVLNSLSALLVLAGFYFIQRRQIPQHKACMLAAFASSSLFLTCYLVYHAHVGSVPFPIPGWPRTLYLTILISHTSLALATVPLVLTTLSRALRGNFEMHKRVARWTFPIWLYVSCTGVLVYVMLYRLAGVH